MPPSRTWRVSEVGCHCGSPMMQYHHIPPPPQPQPQPYPTQPPPTLLTSSTSVVVLPLSVHSIRRAWCEEGSPRGACVCGLWLLVAFQLCIICLQSSSSNGCSTLTYYGNWEAVTELHVHNDEVINNLALAWCSLAANSKLKKKERKTHTHTPKQWV